MIKAYRRWVNRYPLLIGGGVLTLIYLCVFFSIPEMPGQNRASPVGWWSWYDQWKTLDSALALARGDWAVDWHWYPVGYAALSVPFTWMGFVAHPFVLVNLACLLLSFWWFVVFAGTVGVRRSVAVAVFIGGAAWDQQMFGEWAIPWNTAPAAAALWGVIALCGLWLAGRPWPVALGAAAAVMPLFRPTETVVVGVCVAWLLAAELRAGRLGARQVARLLLGGASVLGPALALHVMIYGWQPSPYMLMSSKTGFSFSDFGWKAYVVLADPYAWFLDGEGFLRRFTWAALGFAGLVPALVRGRGAGVLAAAVLAHLVLYVSYVDLLPIGLWRFNNIHYWQWAVPGYALLAWLLLRDLAGWRHARPWAAFGGLALVGAVAWLRVVPGAAGPGEAAKMLAFRGEPPVFATPLFGNQIALRDGRGVMRNVEQMRIVPEPDGMRVFALSRRFDGPVKWEATEGLPATTTAAVPERVVPRLGWGRPCWVPGTRCGARPRNPLLPPY